jgi:hypothetical protein
MIKLKRLLTESKSETAGIGDLYKLYKYKDTIAYILTEEDMELKVKAGNRLVTALGGLYKAKLVMMGAIDSIDKITMFIKPLLPNPPKPLLIDRAEKLFAAMGFSTTTTNTAVNAIRNICKDLGVTVQ